MLCSDPGPGREAFERTWLGSYGHSTIVTTRCSVPASRQVTARREPDAGQGRFPRSSDVACGPAPLRPSDLSLQPVKQVTFLNGCKNMHYFVACEHVLYGIQISVSINKVLWEQGCRLRLPGVRESCQAASDLQARNIHCLTLLRKKVFPREGFSFLNQHVLNHRLQGG